MPQGNNSCSGSGLGGQTIDQHIDTDIGEDELAKRMADAEGLAKQYGYTIADLRSPARSKELAFARHVSMFLMKRLTERSLHDIGTFLHRSDHTTVVHAVDKIGQLMAHDQIISSTVTALEKRMRSL